MSEQNSNEISESVKTIENEKPKYTKRSNQISRETSVLLSNLISDKKTVNPLEQQYAKAKDDLKFYNANKNVSETKFQALYTEFIESESLSLTNDNLKRYLITMFDLLRDNIELSELNARLSVQSISALVEGCLIAVISKVSGKSFDELTKDYDSKAISDKSISSVKANFNKILALIT